MRVLLVINLLVVICVLLSESTIIDDSSDLKQELFHYKHQARIVYKLLEEACPEEVRHKRDTSNGEISLTNLELKVQKLHYNTLLRKLNECLERNRSIHLMKAQTTALKSTAVLPATTVKSIATVHLTPLQTPARPELTPCLSATNLSESWRMDHNGKRLEGGGPNASGGDACDLRRGLQWFRFTGAAGTQMLNKCPKLFSCGTYAGMWTDAAMPTAVGVPTDITVYGSKAPGNSCKDSTIQVEVMRCSMSTDHDFIYRYTGSNSVYNNGYPSICSLAFCGMM